MMLLTKALRRRLLPLGSTDNMDPAVTQIIVKFFNPLGYATWYATEFDPETRIFFGWAELFPDCGELGYFSLDEMEDFNRTRAVGIERDRHFGDHMLAEVMNGKRP